MGTKIPAVILFHPFSSFSQLQCGARKMSQRSGAIAPHSPALPAAKSLGSFLYSFRILQPLPISPTSQFIFSLGFQDFQTHCFDNTRIFNTSCPEGSGCHSHGEFFPHPGRSSNPFSWNWETPLSHHCRASNISSMSNCTSFDQMEGLNINCMLCPLWFQFQWNNPTSLCAVGIILIFLYLCLFFLGNNY